MANERLARGLGDAGHTVDVITYPFGQAAPHPLVSVHRCRPTPLVRSVGIGLSAAKLLLDLNLAVLSRELIHGSDFDCIHAVEEGIFIGAWLGERNEIPVIYDMDSVLSREVAGRIPPIGLVARAAERWAIRRSSIVVTISQAMAKHVTDIVPGSEVFVIPDVPICRSTGDAERARAMLPVGFRERKIVMYTGSFARYQGLDTLVSAMRRVSEECPDVALVLVGGEEREIERLSESAKAQGVMRNMLFVGKKPPEELPDYLALADVLVSPRRGGINPPGKIYTYMQSGKPIVATDIQAHTDVLTSDAAILVSPTPDGIADGILRALADPKSAAVKAARAREMVRGMNPEAQKRQMLALYERLLAGAIPR